MAFKRDALTTGQLVSVPCGRCIGCRIDRTRQWMVRNVHENMMHNESAFLTLTIAPENMEKHGPSVSNLVHQKFIRALRKKLEPKKIRFYMCGEYGENFNRPHYHYLIFGHGFPDKTPWQRLRGIQYYRSEFLEKIWTYGFATIGAVTPETAGYTARYVMKKFLGDESDKHYQAVDASTGELIQLTPEFCRMSLKPGIGQEWFEKYGRSDIYDSGDFVVINGKKYRCPRYYDKLLGELDERELETIKATRKAAANKSEWDWRRLEAQEEVTLAKLTKLKRGYEDEA